MVRYCGFKAIIVPWHPPLWCIWAKGSDTCCLFVSTHSIWMMNMTQICYVSHRNNDVILPSYKNVLCFHYPEKKAVHVCDLVCDQGTEQIHKEFDFFFWTCLLWGLYTWTRADLDSTQGLVECCCREWWEMRSGVRGTYGELCGWLRLDNRCKHLLPQHTSPLSGCCWHYHSLRLAFVRENKSFCLLSISSVTSVSVLCLYKQLQKQGLYALYISIHYEGGRNQI